MFGFFKSKGSKFKGNPVFQKAVEICQGNEIQSVYCRVDGLHFVKYSEGRLFPHRPIQHNVNKREFDSKYEVDKVRKQISETSTLDRARGVFAPDVELIELRFAAYDFPVMEESQMKEFCEALADALGAWTVFSYKDVYTYTVASGGSYVSGAGMSTASGSVLSSSSASLKYGSTSDIEHEHTQFVVYTVANNRYMAAPPASAASAAPKNSW